MVQCFILLTLKQGNVVVVAIIIMIHMQKCVFLMLLKTQMSKRSIYCQELMKQAKIKWHETCKYKCRLDASVCNNKQFWNNDKCRCGCKELIDKRVCDKGFIWNPSNFKCECDKLCDVGEHLDSENCKCRKKLADKLVEECTETVEHVKKAENTINAILAYCTLCYFQYFLQLTLELALILFTRIGT